MDRKAFARCAATASLSALLSVGCGNGSVEPVTVARQQTRPPSSPPVVVVSPEKDFFASAPYAPAAPASEPQPVAVAAVEANNSESSIAPTDPWDDTQSTTEVVEEQGAATAESTSQAVETQPGDPPGATDSLAPVSADDSSENEIKFAMSGDAAPLEDGSAVETIKIRVQSSGNDASAGESVETVADKSQTGSRFASGDVKRELLPVLVTPRTTPQKESNSTSKIANAPQAGPIVESNEPTTRVEPSPAATSVKTEPTLAKVTPKTEPVSIAAEPQVAATGPTPSDALEPTPAEPTPATTNEPSDGNESTLIVKVAPTEDEPATETALEPVAAKTETSLTQQTPQPAVEGLTKTPAVRAPAEATPAAEPRTISPPPSATVSVTPAQPPRVEPTDAAPSSAPLAKASPAPISPSPVPVATVAQPAASAPAAATPVAPAGPVQPNLPSVPLPQVAGTRSPAMVAAMARADERVRHAIQLAEKGAMYASRKEFTSAITLIAQAHDIERGTRQHSLATAAGFQALKEAADFVSMSPTDMNMARLVAGHKTPVLKDLNVADLPPALAAQYYYNYAKEHLAAGVGRETVGSIALYGLAKIILAGAGQNAQQPEFTGPAMALYQAALICEPQNFRAAHELGVLLAGSGQLEQARQMLMGSVAVSPQPVMLKNLAVVHSRLGEPQLAAQAQQQAEVLQQTSPNTKVPPVQWVDPATFASLGTGTDASNPPKSPATSAATPPSTNEAATPAVARKRPTSWTPNNLRR